METNHNINPQNLSSEGTMSFIPSVDFRQCTTDTDDEGAIAIVPAALGNDVVQGFLTHIGASVVGAWTTIFGAYQWAAIEYVK
ncbi:MAG TPA: hypothetical protein VM013_01150 [Dehalococcoidia bacterium]|nr:hypothetical protein [Dehalococcoidia bacterium]